jgi:hypothetical protein
VPRAAIYLVLAFACSSRTEPSRTEPPPRPDDPPSARVVEAPGPVPVPAVEPPDQPPVRAPVRPAPARAVRPIEVVLRSSPPGATAAVDGKPIGPTPAYWSGDADGREHEFTFALLGYASARYRFVPITSGVIHARLEVLVDETEAGTSASQVPLGAAPSRVPLAPDAAPSPSEAAPASGAGPQP